MFKVTVGWCMFKVPAGWCMFIFMYSMPAVTVIFYL